jgi:hypothetical protein
VSLVLIDSAGLQLFTRNGPAGGEVEAVDPIESMSTQDILDKLYGEIEGRVKEKYGDPPAAQKVRDKAGKGRPSLCRCEVPWLVSRD